MPATAIGVRFHTTLPLYDTDGELTGRVMHIDIKPTYYQFNVYNFLFMTWEQPDDDPVEAWIIIEQLLKAGNVINLQQRNIDDEAENFTTILAEFDTFSVSSHEEPNIVLGEVVGYHTVWDVALLDPVTLAIDDEYLPGTTTALRLLRFQFADGDPVYVSQEHLYQCCAALQAQLN